MRPPRQGVTLSDAITEAYASAPEQELIYDTLEFNHPLFVDDTGAPMPVRVVNDHANLAAKLESGLTVLFYACYFKFTRPEQAATGSAPEVQVQVDNVAHLLMPYMEKVITSRIPVTMTWRPYLASDLSGPHILPVMTLELRNVQADTSSMTAKAGFSNLTNFRFPGNEYKSIQFPGLTVR